MAAVDVPFLFGMHLADPSSYAWAGKLLRRNVWITKSGRQLYEALLSSVLPGQTHVLDRISRGRIKLPSRWHPKP